MKMLMARSTERYGKRKLKDIQPFVACTGFDTMTSQSVPVTSEGSGWRRAKEVGLPQTDSREEHEAPKSKYNAMHFGISVYHYTPPDLIMICGQ
jgi:hypothetical protein